jgi:NAD(P)-dependent dehydrogenase (short-subunit alcohol dehydrogenase family)
VTGALAGLAKTAALEWPDVVCRVLDVAPQWPDSAAAAARVVDELLFADPAAPMEIGLSPLERVTLNLSPLPLDDRAVDLGPNDVVVLTGGGRGITAAAALALSQAARPKLALIGRSPEPAPEPDWLAGLTDPAEIKKAIARQTDRPTPAQIETVFRDLMAGRQIRASLAAIAASGSPVRYFSADVRDRRQVNGVFKAIRSLLGPIRGLIHGAGILEDRRIGDKTPAQFEAVFTTKVSGLDNLLAAAADDPLSHIVLFSSVSARFGNKGQADYAMANEALNKLGRQLAQNRPACRVIAVNWGPWDGGMVTPALKKQFQSRAIPLIAPEVGSRLLVQLMAAAPQAAVEVVAGGALASLTQPALPDQRSEKMAVAVKRELDTQGHPILKDHVIDGRPVVPMALIMEWLCHSALHEHPGMVLHGMDDLRVLAGIKLETDPKAIRLMAGRSIKKDPFFEVGVEIRDGIMADGRDMIHARGKALLAPALAPPPAYDLPAWAGQHPYGRSIDAIYESILFHGQGLRAIRQIECLAPEGMVAQMAAAPAPRRWIAQPLRSRWVSDPLVLDGAFQMATIWCHETRGVVCLPSFASAYRQYQERFPVEGVAAVMEVVAVSGSKMKADFTLIDHSGRVVATISGVESVMDKALAKAFQRRQVITAGSVSPLPGKPLPR